ncbi:MAG TPA: aldo/keto reductase [Alphaproteobacteria bacterium]|nr:aldo/keto reductase [Alphaproteobacteria bacterium]
MDPFARRRLGQTQVMLPALGFGGAPLGNLFTTIDEEQAYATVTAAWQAGIRYYDTSPWYGRGLSEHRLGRVLHSKPREEMIVSTKVGRLFTAPADAAAFARSERAWPQGLMFEHHFDYSYDGIMRSYEDSLQRLGMNRIDLLIIHDLDRTSFAADALVRAHLDTLATSGMRALQDLKAAGLIGAVGAGVNRVGTIPLFLDVLELDFFLVALPYTLAEQPVLDTEFPLCEERGVGIIIGAPFASGILATGAVPGAKLNYRDATPEEARRISRIEAICASFDVPLAAAALQFPLHHPLVAAVIPGAFAPEHPLRNVATMQCEVPDELWRRLKAEGLLRQDAPTP